MPAGGGCPAVPPGARSHYLCAALADGRVLVAGGESAGEATSLAQTYDPATRSWTQAGAMSAARVGATASRLADGRVLVAGGEVAGAAVATLEVFDPVTNLFSPAAGALLTPRAGHAAVVLKNGRVLLAGGSDGVKALDSIELYDPNTGESAVAGRLSRPRTALSATLLLDGRVFFAGGNNGEADLASTEIYDPVRGGSVAAAPMSLARRDHTAVRVPDNNTVLIAGGTSGGEAVNAAERFVPWWNRMQAVSRVQAAHRNAGAPGRTAKDDVGGGAISSPTLVSDKQDYSPGEIVNLTGTGWQPGETVRITMSVDPPNHDTVILTPAADALGNLADTSYTVQTSDLGVTFTVTATGEISGATAQNLTFADTCCALTLTVTGPGSVTSDAGGINCPGTCSVTLPYNTNVTLTAAAGAGNSFQAWGGFGCNGITATPPTCTEIMNSNRTVTAKFVAKPALTVTIAAGSGTGKVTSDTGGIDCTSGSCSAVYDYNAVVTLTAAPDPGSTAAFTGGGCGGPTCVVTMSAAKTVTVTFSGIKKYLVLNPVPNNGGVIADGNGMFNCGGGNLFCSGSGNFGTLTLTATPKPGYVFGSWSGDYCAGVSGNSCTFTFVADPNKARVITATFLPAYPLSVTLAGDGAGTVTGTSAGINCPGTCSASAGGVVTLSAAAAAGSTFTGWGGACSGTGSCSVTMSAAQSVTASFDAAPVLKEFRILFGSRAYNLLGSARNRLPWQVSGIQVVFSKAITTGGTGSLTGVSAASFSGGGTSMLTWTFSPVSQGAFNAALDAASLKDAAGTPVAAFSRTVKVLQGDFNDDGAVSSADMVSVNNARSGVYNVFADVDGNGVVDASDVQIVRSRIGATLP